MSLTRCRATGNQMYRDWAWDAFVAINATTRVGSGFSSINNVNVAGGGGFQNVQESFLFAEVMKYSYLIQSPVRNPLPLRYAYVDRTVTNTDYRMRYGRSRTKARTRSCSTPRRIRSGCREHLYRYSMRCEWHKHYDLYRIPLN